MLIYDSANKRVLSEITLFLDPSEAAELGFSCSDLSDHPEKQHHHVSDSSFSKEITVAVYTPENLSKFNTETQQLLASLK